MRNPIPVIEAVLSENPADIEAQNKYRIAVLELLNSVNNQLILLNARIEEGLETGIELGDVQDDIF